MFFTVHIYQYRVEKNSKNAGGGKTQPRSPYWIPYKLFLGNYENMAVYQVYAFYPRKFCQMR